MFVPPQGGGMEIKMDQKKKKVAWQQYVGMLFMVLIGVACGVFMVVLVDRFGDGRPLHEELLSLVALLAAMYIAIFFHLILHEMGHLVFGKLSGYTFGSFRIFSFMWIKENGKLRLMIILSGEFCIFCQFSNFLR